MNLKLIRSVLLKNGRKPVYIGTNYLGRIAVSLYTLESLAKRKIMQIPELKKAVVKAEKQAGTGVRFKIDICVREQTPSLNEIIQIAVKDEICSLTGIQQQKIDVAINSVTVDKPRVK